MNEVAGKRINVLLKIGSIFKWSSLLLAAIVVIGWILRNEVLKRLFIASDPMNPMTAFLFITLSLSIIVKQRSVTSPHWLKFAFGLIISVSVLQSIQLLGLPIRIDHLFFGNFLGNEQDGVNPMAPASAFLFILICTAKWLRFTEWKWTSELILVIAFTVVIFMITGYLFQVPEFHSSIKLFPALHSCLLFLIIILSIFFSRPQQGVVGLLVNDLEGARIGRTLIIFTVLVPLTLAYLRMLAQWNNLISSEMGVAVGMGSYILIFTTGLFITVASLNERDQLRKNDTVKINELNTELQKANLEQNELNKELATFNEELQASSENLSATNQELLATNEKLEEAVQTIKMQNEIILEQKEAALRRSEEYLEIIFSNTEEEILLLDREGKVVMFNRALSNFIQKATGKRPKMGMYVWDMTVTSRSDNSKNLFSRALNGEVVMEEASIMVNGELVVHLLKYEPVWQNGEIKFITLISLDITGQKEVSEQLKDRLDQLQKTNYELDRFVYSVSHDLRAPLSSILGLVNVAEMENTSKEVPYLDMIKGRIKTLDNFIKSILDYSRNSRTDVQSQEIDFNMLIEATQDSLRTMNGFASLETNIDVQQETPFYSDSMRIATIFNNLFSNAIRFQDNHKHQSILEVKVLCTNNHANIVVRDNGIGIAIEHQPNVFNMFYRATDQAVGSGIGLYLVKETVSKLNGTIRLNSEFGRFTEFDITLPNKSA